MAEILLRKGATKIDKIPADVLESLNKGEIETVNLVEWLAIDHKTLIKNVLQDTIYENNIEPIIKLLEKNSKDAKNGKITVLQATFLIGRYFYWNLLEAKEEVTNRYIAFLSSHKSDSVRCYACYLIACDDMFVEKRLEKIKILAADPHFGVREIAWIAIRPAICKTKEELEKVIDILSVWAQNDDENIRRFASEITRPRGVWCKHIDILKENPTLALPILNALCADRSKYVRDSVGNWLNDASKTQPDFVKNLCAEWEEKSKKEDENKQKATAYIIKKALRSIK
jgi:3-methyladenine DNA glycosylase AlkC